VTSELIGKKRPWEERRRRRRKKRERRKGVAVMS
jgi:hypothetical protein